MRQNDEARMRLRDACEELEAALSSLRSVTNSADATFHEVRLSQADVCLRRAEEHLQTVPHGATMIRFRMAMRRAVREIWSASDPSHFVHSEIAHIERGLERLRRMAEPEP